MGCTLIRHSISSAANYKLKFSGLIEQQVCGPTTLSYLNKSMFFYSICPTRPIAFPSDAFKRILVLLNLLYYTLLLPSNGTPVHRLLQLIPIFKTQPSKPGTFKPCVHHLNPSFYPLFLHPHLHECYHFRSQNFPRLQSTRYCYPLPEPLNHYLSLLSQMHVTHNQ